MKPEALKDMMDDLAKLIELDNSWQAEFEFNRLNRMLDGLPKELGLTMRDLTPEKIEELWERVEKRRLLR